MIGGFDSSISFSAGAGIGYPVRRVPIPVQYVPIPSSSYGAYGGGGPQVVCVRPSNSSSLFNLDNLLDLASKGVQLLVLVGGAWFGVKWLGNHETGKPLRESFKETATQALGKLTEVQDKFFNSLESAQETVSRTANSKINFPDLSEKLNSILGEVGEAHVSSSAKLKKIIEEHDDLTTDQKQRLTAHLTSEANRDKSHILVLLDSTSNEENSPQANHAIILTPRKPESSASEELTALENSLKALKSWETRAKEAAKSEDNQQKNTRLEKVGSLRKFLETNYGNSDKPKSLSFTFFDSDAKANIDID